MPKRWVHFPDYVVFYDPLTRQALQRKDGSADVMDFGEFLQALMHNPVWSEGYAQAQAQDSILRAYEAATKNGEDGMWIAEEDHKILERTVREPKSLHIGPLGPQITAGFGRHPSMARQFLPLQEAVIKAKTEIEKARADETLKRTG